MNIARRIDNIKLTNSEKSALNKIINNNKITANITINELAESSEVSKSTISRLTRKLGFASFSEFKVELYISKSSNIKDQSKDYTENDFTGVNPELLSFYYHLQYQLEKSIKTVNYESITYISEKLLKSSKIVIVGFSSSGIVAEEMYYQLRKHGLNASLVNDPHRLGFECYNLGSNDSILFFSHGGNIPEQIETAKIANKNKATTITVSSEDTSLLSLECVYSVAYDNSDKESIFNLEPYHTLTQLFIGYAILNKIRINTTSFEVTSNHEIVDFLMKTTLDRK